MSVYDLKGHQALITGAARGLGAGIAQAMARAGAGVIIADVLEKEGEATAAAIRSAGGKASFVRLDVTEEGMWERAIGHGIKELGGLDVLVNNAGIEVTALVTEIDPKALRQMLDVNVVGTALGLKHGLRAMRKGGAAGKGGCIINISSVAATIAFPGIAGYSGTKSAVDRMTRVAAMESGKLGYGVRVNCIYPGLVATAMGLKLAQDMVTVGLAPSTDAAVKGVIDQTPLGRLGEVADMADVAVFLASDAARFVTGVGIPVDGGMGM
jgi:NAD(P)-dependent dehydrogenase (short-subunit alcohol dehydrogenase family)